MRALPRNYFAACVAVLVSLVAAATSAIADDKSLKLQVAEIATSFIEPLPMDKKYVLKSLSPDATGIPEDFLRKLTSDVEAGLLFASDNEMNLINRDATEEIWQEATEFNNAQFQELYANSSADVMIMISPRLTADGVEISLTAYELSGEDVGKVLASSGTSVLEMDVKATLGVDVNGIDAKLDSVLEALQDSKPKPKTPEEISAILYDVGKQMDWFKEEYGAPSWVNKDGEYSNSGFTIGECSFKVSANDEEIFRIEISIVPKVCDVLIGEEYVSEMTLGDFYQDELSQWNACGNCATSTAEPEVSYVTTSWRSLDSYPDTEITIVDYNGDLYGAFNWNRQADQGNFLQNLNKFDSLIRTQLRDAPVYKYALGKGIFNPDSISDDSYLDLSPTPKVKTVVKRLLRTFVLMSEQDQNSVRKILKEKFNLYSDSMEKIYSNAAPNQQVGDGFTQLIDYVIENSPRDDYRSSFGKNFFADQGLLDLDISPENLMRFIENLNCEDRGLLKGTAYCS